MKRVLLFGAIIAALSLLGGLVVPVLADVPEDGETASVEQEAWEVMHEACEDADWEVMDEAAGEVLGEDFASMPCHDEGYYSSDEGDRVSPRGWDGMGGGMMGSGMGGGMMGGDWGGMM